MSCRKGSEANTRNRPQKYKNRTAFRNDLHDTSPALKLMNSIQVCEVCQHCKSVIEWKIKYKKYKVLTQQKTCRRCNQKTIKRAYHVLCKPCAKEERVCAKCCKSSLEVEIEPAAPTQEEENKLKMELEQLVKSLPERKRRTYLRFAKKGKKAPVNEDDLGKFKTFVNPMIYHVNNIKFFIYRQ